MSKSQSRFMRSKEKLYSRWSAEDYPGGTPRFQIKLFSKDFLIFILLPVLAIVLFKSCEVAFSNDKRTSPQRQNQDSFHVGIQKSQIIDFRNHNSVSPLLGISKRAPGTLVKVRLLNAVETYSNAPVHAQIVDAGLGENLVGSTILGDAVSDPNYHRITITFNYVRFSRRADLSIPISARALSLDGTLGLSGRKKEGFFARASLSSSGSVEQNAEGKTESTDLKHMIAKALTAGLIQEFGSDAQVARNRAQVLTLQPPNEFYVELTEYFPGSAR